MPSGPPPPPAAVCLWIVGIKCPENGGESLPSSADDGYVYVNKSNRKTAALRLFDSRQHEHRKELDSSERLLQSKDGLKLLKGPALLSCLRHTCAETSNMGTTGFLGLFGFFPVTSVTS